MLVVANSCGSVHIKHKQIVWFILNLARMKCYLV